MSITFDEALEFARVAHAGQLYKLPGGKDEPYINHPIRVAEEVSNDARIVAILHDCLEDAGQLPPGLSEIDQGAIGYLTRDKKEDLYEVYILKIASAPGMAGKIAREVKMADLRENLSKVQPGRFENKRRLYVRALLVLASKGE